MKYTKKGYNRLLVGDLYHWVTLNDDDFMIEKNNKREYATGGV